MNTWENRYHQRQAARIVVPSSNARRRVDRTRSHVQCWIHSRRIHHCQASRTRASHVPGRAQLLPKAMKSPSRLNLESLVTLSGGIQCWPTGQRSHRSRSPVPHWYQLRNSHCVHLSSRGLFAREKSLVVLHYPSFSPSMTLARAQCIYSSTLTFHPTDRHVTSDRYQGEERRMPQDIDCRGSDRWQLSGRGLVRCKSTLDGCTIDWHSTLVG